MVIIDFSQIIFSNLHQHLANSPVLDEDLFRHMVINSIRGYNKKYRKKYGSVVVAMDSRTYWRKDTFPLYKYKRKIDRDANNTIDWESFFEIFNKLKLEMREVFPYKFIEVDGAEGDDIIGVLTQKYAIHEPIMIVSSDHDFKQLHRFKGVSQFSPMQKKAVTTKNAVADLKEKIIRGDKGDGIPCFLAGNDIFKVGGRQPSIYQKKLDVWLGQEPEDFCDEEQLARYRENEVLIDLTKTPQDVRLGILEAFEVRPKGSKIKIMQYFGQHKMRVMLDYIEDF